MQIMNRNLFWLIKILFTAPFFGIITYIRGKCENQVLL